MQPSIRTPYDRVVMAVPVTIPYVRYSIESAQWWIGRALKASRPDTVLVSGWRTYAAQAAVAWCRRNGVPYVLLVESHDAGQRAAWRRAVKDTLVPPIVRGAAACLAVGTLARESLIARGAPAERVRVFANTIDVDGWIARANELRRRRNELRGALGAGEDDVVVLSVGRLVREKGFPTLLDAVARADDERLLVAIAGSGPEHAALASHEDVRLRGWHRGRHGCWLPALAGAHALRRAPVHRRTVGLGRVLYGPHRTSGAH